MYVNAQARAENQNEGIAVKDPLNRLLVATTRAGKTVSVPLSSLIDSLTKLGYTRSKIDSAIQIFDEKPPPTLSSTIEKYVIGILTNKEMEYRYANKSNPRPTAKRNPSKRPSEQDLIDGSREALSVASVRYPSHVKPEEIGSFNGLPPRSNM